MADELSSRVSFTNSIQCNNDANFTQILDSFIVCAAPSCCWPMIERQMLCAPEAPPVATILVTSSLHGTPPSSTLRQRRPLSAGTQQACSLPVGHTWHLTRLCTRSNRSASSWVVLPWRCCSEAGAP
jgi:hypothetical protein